MEVTNVIYEDGVIAVALVASDRERPELTHLAIKWLPPAPYRRADGVEVLTTNIMGGETDWFVVPRSLAVGVARSLIEKKAASARGFQEDGFAAMVAWLVAAEDLDDSMCY